MPSTEQVRTSETAWSSHGASFDFRAVKLPSDIQALSQLRSRLHRDIASRKRQGLAVPHELVEFHQMVRALKRSVVSKWRGQPNRDEIFRVPGSRRPADPAFPITFISTPTNCIYQQGRRCVCANCVFKNRFCA